MLANVRAIAVTSVLLAVAVFGAGCGAGAGGGGGTGGEAAAARDREKAKAGWLLKLEEFPSALALSRMDVFLTEDETAPEVFDIRGEGVRLVGMIPGTMQVGYGEAFDKLVGRSLAIDANGGDPSEPGVSSVTVDGVTYPVAGGTFTIEKLSGKWEGSEGDKTLHGSVELRLLGAEGDRTVRGTMSVHVVTWG